MQPEPSSHDERELRAVRNQALFRAVNDQIKDMNQAFATLTGSFAITCECADTTCIDTIVLSPAEFDAIRAEPRQFAVLPGHVYPEVETVVREADAYVVVEKNATVADVAEALDLRRTGE